ncbi:DUF2637 domain-containing protein (plasmid) [Streptomyces clavifer]|uniref:DUF2637 domain-containing protein n=1 Tax=Streptomyces clavifer TaxID=68188 RepID=UPI002E815E4E|nr:DUF2637 domain-containing protein [Streptomyces clavifer]WUC32704.1 DUF2637 domain-containing protein [Streptomyces clavifer]
MSTTTMEPEAGPASGARSSAERRENPTAGTPVAAKTGPIAATGTAVAEKPEPVAREQPGGRHKRLMIPLAVLAILSGLAAASVGFALSYGALRSAAVGWGFGAGWQSYAFPIGVDGLIIALYTVDLVLAWKRMARPWMRIAAHAVTGVTIVLNMAAAAGSAGSAGASTGLLSALGEHPARLLSHAAMPIAYALLIEAARGAVVRVARLESGSWDDDRLTLADWVLRFPTTWKIFKHAKTWPSTITEARTHVRELAVYRIWLAHREEIEAGLEAGRVGVLDRMPQRLAPYGVSVEEARALPALMQERERKRAEDTRREEQDRTRREEQRERDETRQREQQARQDERERQRQAREDEHTERLAALAAEAEETRLAGELAVLRAETAGAARAAEATADGAGAAAELQAQTTLAAARRVATEEERLAALEEAAEETERTAAAKRKAAEHDRLTAELQRKAAEEAARTADARAAEERGKAEEARQKLFAERAATEAADLRRTAAETTKAAAAAELEAAETARAAAETRARVAHAEALADLTPVQIKTRVAARVLLTNPQADGAEISAALGGASPSTASTYRKAAVELIAQGYPEHDPDLTAAPVSAPVSIPGQTEITV